MANDILSMTLELKDKFSEQIKEACKDTEHLSKVVSKLNVDLTKITAEKMEQNLAKNVKDAEKALYSLLEVKEKVDNALSKNQRLRSEGLLGMDESQLLRASARLDEIIDRLINMGAEAKISGRAVKDLLAELSSDIAIKDAKGSASIMDKGLEKQVKERAKAQKAAVKEIESAFEDADKAAKNNVKNQELVKDALARIATARANLSAASDGASMQDQAHARLLMSLLDQLATKLNALKNEFLGEKGMLDGVLGSGYKGLMRNVDVSIKDIVRNAMNQGGMGDAEWQSHKAAAEAAEQHKQKLQELTIAFNNLIAQQEKAAQRQSNYYQSQQKATQATRQRAEELVKLRMELLRTQAAELQGLMKNGKGVFSAQQYQDVQNALRGVREELRQLEGVMQHLSSYSTRDLLGFGRGSQNWSPLIANGQQILNTMNAVRQLSLEEEKLMQSIDKASSAFQNQNRILGDLQMMTGNYLSLWGAKDFLNNIIQIGGQLEAQRLSIGAILGDTAHANDLFERIKALAVQSPFGVVELDQYTKQLSAYGFKYNELYDMTKRLADISAGAGTDVSRLALALGHVRAEAALSGYTLRQFAMNNIPMVSELAKLLTETEGKLVSVADVRKRVRSKDIGYEEVETVIKRLTDEGGMFYNMQEVISQSVKARWKNLKDSLDIMYGEMAEAKVGGVLKDTAIVLTNLSRHWKELFAVLQTGLVVLGTYKALMLANTLMLGREATAVQAGTAAKIKADKANIALASSYRLLTAEEMRFNGISGETLVMANALALSEKKLTAEGIARQVALGKLTKAQGLQAVALADLTAAERIHAQTVVGNVLTYGRFTGVINTITMSVKGLGVALKGLLWNPLTAIFAAVGVVTEVWQKNNEEVERAAELNDSLFNRATEGIRNIKQMMAETGMTFTINGRDADFGDMNALRKGQFDFTPANNMNMAEMVSAVQTWTQFIKEYSANPNNILNASFANEAGEVRTLEEQYERLGKAVSETAEAYVWLKQASEATEFAENLSNGFFDDSLITNINDYAQDIKDYNDAISTSVVENRKFWSVILNAARAHAGFAGTLEREGIDVENLSSQIKVLIEDQERYAGAIELAKEAAKGMGRTLSEFERTPDSYIPLLGYDTSIQDYYVSMRESQQAMESDMDIWIDGMKQRLIDLGWNIKNLSESQKQAVALAIAETVAKANKGTDDIRKSIVNLMKEKFGITIDANTAQAAANIGQLKKSLEDLVGHDWTINVKSATDFDGVISNIRKTYKAAKEYLANTKPLAIQMGIDVSAGMQALTLPQKDIMIANWRSNNPGKDSKMYEMFLDQWNELAKGMQDAIDFSKATGISLEDQKKNKPKGSNADEELKKWKERKKALDEYYKLYKDYVQYMTKEEAIKRINDTGLIKGQALPSNIDDYLAVMKDFMDGIKGKISTTERQSFWDILVGDYNKKDFEQNTKEVIDSMLSKLDEELKKQGKQWDLFRKIMDATGNKEQAAQIAFGGSVRFDNYAQQLREEINQALQKNDKANGVSIDKLLGMDDKALQNIDIFKNGTDGIYRRLKELKDVEQSLQAEDVELFLDAIKNAKSLETELDAITVKYNRTRNAIIAQGGNPDLLANADKNEAREKSDKQWEYFKRDTDYGRVFGDLNNMSNATLKTMHDKLVDFAPSVADSVEATKALYDAIDKINDLMMERNPFSAIATSIGNQQGIRMFMHDFSGAKGNEMIGLNGKMAKKYGLTDGTKGWTGTKNQALDALMKNGNNAAKAMAGISKMFKQLQGALSPVIELFNLLGETSLGEYFNAAGSAIGSAVDTFSSFQSLSDQLFTGTGGIGDQLSNALGSAGPYAAAASAAFSLVSSFSAMHDAALQEEIDASKARQKEVKNLEDNLEKALERILGGVYNPNMKASEDDIKTLLRYINGHAEDKIMEEFGVPSLLAARQYQHIDEVTLRAIDEALKSESYYDTKLAELYIQRDELKKQMQAEEDKKDSDSEAIEDYKQQIKEMEDDIVNFALDMANALYDIDLKDWASQLTDAIVEAWEAGEDAVDAYKNKVKELAKDLTKNILAKKVVEMAFERSGLQQLIADLMDSTNGILNENAVMSIADAINSVAGTSANTITAILDALEAKGYIEKGDGSSSSKKLIQGGFTENETGLLLSYVNAIRADVSVDRYNLDKILLAVQSQAEMPTIAQAQLQELRTIVANTRRNAEAAEMIYDILHRAQIGSQGIKIY